VGPRAGLDAVVKRKIKNSQFLLGLETLPPDHPGRSSQYNNNNNNNNNNITCISLYETRDFCVIKKANSCCLRSIICRVTQRNFIVL